MSADPDDFEEIAAIQAAYRDQQEALLQAYRDLARAADAMLEQVYQCNGGNCGADVAADAYASARAAVEKLDRGTPAQNSLTPLPTK